MLQNWQTIVLLWGPDSLAGHLDRQKPHESEQRELRTIHTFKSIDNAIILQ